MMRMFVLISLCVPCFAQDVQQLNNREERLADLGLVQIDMDKEIARETNQKLLELQKELAELCEVQKLVNELVGEQGGKIEKVEENVETAEHHVEDGVEDIVEASELKRSNFISSLLLKDGLPLGAGAVVGTTGFFATKTALLATPLAVTSAPAIIPTILGLAMGGGIWIGGKYLSHKLL